MAEKQKKVDKHSIKVVLKKETIYCGEGEHRFLRRFLGYARLSCW
jgi:hypothetical protein